MGQKVNPHGARVGVIKGWDSRWFADKKEFAKSFAEMQKVYVFDKTEILSLETALNAVDKLRELMDIEWN